MQPWLVYRLAGHSVKELPLFSLAALAPELSPNLVPFASCRYLFVEETANSILRMVEGVDQVWYT